MALFSGTNIFGTPKKLTDTSAYTQARIKKPATTQTTPIVSPPAASLTPQPLTLPAITQPSLSETTTPEVAQPVTEPPATTAAHTVDGVDVDEWYANTKRYDDYQAAYEQFWSAYVAQHRAGSRNPEMFDDPIFKRDLMASLGWPSVTNIVAVTKEDDQGNPIATGYWINGEFYILNDLRAVNEAERELGEIDVPTLREWMEEQGYDFQEVTESSAWQGLQDLIASIQSPETQEEWQAGGLGWAEQLMGLEPGEYGGSLRDLLARMEENQAQSPFEMTAEQQRAIASETRETIENSKLLLEALASEGRDVQALVTADEISSSIANTEIQSRLKYAEFNFNQREAEYANLAARYENMVRTGVMTATENIQRQREHAALQVSLYANEIAMIESANSQYLTEYQAELMGLEAHANAIMAYIDTLLGVDAALVEQIKAAYEAALAPITQQLAMLELQMQQEALDRAAQQQMWSSVLQLLGTGITAILGAL